MSYAKLFNADNVRLLGRALTSKRLTTHQLGVVWYIGVNADKYNITDPRHMAYMLATAWHETLWQCIEEIRAKPGTVLSRRQGRYWGWHGRGPIQLTWEKNYRKFEQRLGIPLTKKPHRALELEVGAEILVDGMVNGVFTGKALKDYIDGEKCDFVAARRIVNGTDQAQRIARFADLLLTVLKTLEVPA